MKSGGDRLACNFKRIALLRDCLIALLNSCGSRHSDAKKALSIQKLCALCASVLKKVLLCLFPSGNCRTGRRACL